MATIRNDLEILNFDFDTGVILYQPSEGYAPGWSYSNQVGEVVIMPEEILDLEYDGGYGAPNCPRFVAYDAVCVYVPCMYDGATWVEKIPLIPEALLGTRELTPYLGGG